MLRKLIAGTAVAGALTFGAAGIAGAATTPSTTDRHEHWRPGAPSCPRSGQGPAREAKVNAWLPKAQAREAKAKANGHTKLADAIAKRITRVQNRENNVNARLAKAQAACGTSAG